MKIPFPENPLAERKKVRIAVRLKNKGAQAVRNGLRKPERLQFSAAVFPRDCFR